MFNLQKAIHKQKQLNTDKVVGLPDRPRQYQDKQLHISTLTDYDSIAEREGQFMAKAFNSRTSIRLRYKWQHRANWGVIFP